MIYWLIKAIAFLFAVMCAFLIVGVLFGGMLLHAGALEHEFAVERIWSLLKYAGVCFIISLIWDTWAQSIKGARNQ